LISRDRLVLEIVENFNRRELARGGFLLGGRRRIVVGGLIQQLVLSTEYGAAKWPRYFL
jgi:hypothetical protein